MLPAGRTLFVRALCGALLLSHATFLRAGAFEVGWPSARAMGVGGACVSIADPSSLPCNPAALALLPKKKGAAVGLMAGAFNQSLYQGLPPGAGTGTAAEQKTPMSLIPHAYVTLPFLKTMVSGTGIYTPFREQTEWSQPDAFSGRFLATKSKVDALDLTQAFAKPLGTRAGLGIGLTYRSSSISSARRLGANLAGTEREIADVSFDTDTVRSFGWTAGVFLRPSASLSFGLSHHSAISTSYQGVAKMTQIATGDPQLDTLVGASFPFGQALPISTKFRFPSQSSGGVTWSPSKPWMFVLETSRTAWSGTNGVAYTVPNAHVLDTTYDLGFRDAWTYRTGARLRFPTGPQLRIGYALEKSPQKDANVGPFYPDADRTTVTAGFGLDWLDIAVGWSTYKQRIITTSAQQFNGNWRANSWTAMLTITK
jgi:long-chain fatty acid transport protein